MKDACKYLPNHKQKKSEHFNCFFFLCCIKQINFDNDYNILQNNNEHIYKFDPFALPILIINFRYFQFYSVKILFGLILCVFFSTLSRSVFLVHNSNKRKLGQCDTLIQAFSETHKLIAKGNQIRNSN